MTRLLAVQKTLVLHLTEYRPNMGVLPLGETLQLLEGEQIIISTPKSSSSEDKAFRLEAGVIATCPLGWLEVNSMNHNIWNMEH